MNMHLKILAQALSSATICLLLGCGKREQITEPNNLKDSLRDNATNYFYSHGTKVLFTFDTSLIAVRFRSPQAYKNYSALKGGLEINQSFNFQDIEILEKSNETVTRSDSASLRKFVRADDGFVGLIRVSGSEKRLLMTNRVIARFKPEMTVAAIDSVLNGAGCVVIERSDVRRGRVVLECPGSRVVRSANALFESDKVEYAHPDFISEVETRADEFPNDPLFIDQWHLHNVGQSNGKVGADISALKAWEITKGSRDVIIAIIDDGFDVEHEDLSQNLFAQIDLSATPPDNDASPESSLETHGTCVAGVAVARGDNNIGVAGSCPDCRFIAIRALAGPVSVQSRAFDEAVKSGASIISNSWGYTTKGHVADDLIDAINNAAQNGRDGLGCVILFAMTNERVDNCFPEDPDISSLESVIAVSRSTNLDFLGKGGYGKCMELVAPTNGGTLGITTTDITGLAGYGPTNYYSRFGGTSSATPLVAGIAGLLLSVNSELTAAQVKEILINTADKIDASNAHYDRNGFSNTHGYGRVNAFQAVKKATGTKRPL